MLFLSKHKQYLMGQDQGRGSHCLDGFLAKKSRSELQLQRGSERSGLKIGGTITSREIRT